MSGALESSPEVAAVLAAARQLAPLVSPNFGGLLLQKAAHELRVAIKALDDAAAADDRAPRRG